RTIQLASTRMAMPAMRKSVMRVRNMTAGAGAIVVPSGAADAFISNGCGRCGFEVLWRTDNPVCPRWHGRTDKIVCPPHLRRTRLFRTDAVVALRGADAERGLVEDRQSCLSSVAGADRQDCLSSTLESVPDQPEVAPPQELPAPAVQPKQWL